MSNIHILYVGNDTALEIEHLRNDTVGAFVNGVGVSVTLLDANGAALAGTVWPLALPYVAGSCGVYRATLSRDLPLVVNARYTARVEVNDYSGQYARWDMACVARVRDG